MSGDDLKRLRDRLGLDRDQLADALNASLRNQNGTAKNYSAETIARWERGRPMTKSVVAFLERLAVAGELDALAAPLEGERIDPGEWQAPPAEGPQDSPPGPGPAPSPQSALTSGSGVYVTACTELWELIATGIGMVGAATGSAAMVADGAIIDADKRALGQAWGKLAETNETFRKMLIGMTEGGAWLQVALVTGTTVSKCWQSHAQYGLAAAQPPPAEGYSDELRDAA